MEFIEKVEELYEKMGDEREFFRFRIYKGYVIFEVGDIYRGKVIIVGVLLKIFEDREFFVEVYLSFEEIFEEYEDYEVVF